MKIEKKYLFVILLIFNACGGDSSSSGKSSSFSEGDNNPIINNLETEDKENIITINGKITKLTLRENTRVAFKVNAEDKSRLTYTLSEGDFHDLYIDSKTGETFFEKPTDYETKSKYTFNVIITDSVGHETKQQVIITIKDTKNEVAPIQEVKLNRPLTEDENKYFITTWKTDNVGISNDNEIIIPTTGDGYNYNVDWGDGTSSINLTLDAKHTYSRSGTYTVKISGKFPRIYFGKNADYNFETYESDSRKILTINQWGENRWNSMAGAFAECTMLEGKASDTPNLSKVKDMSSMFAESSFNQNINNWNVSTVEDLEMMFFLSPFNQDLGNWDTSNVTNMTGVFMWSQFNKDIRNWDTSNVTDMSFMFALAPSFNQNIGNWDTSSVKKMTGMFLGAKSFDRDISKWDVSTVTSMYGMFQRATAFNQDLESWHVASTVAKTDMFTAADSLLILPSWYNIDKDINTRKFIIVADNLDKEACKVGVIETVIDGNVFSNLLVFNENIDKSTLIAGVKERGNVGCESYGREDQLIDCSFQYIEGSLGEVCVIGFNFEKKK